MEQKKEVGQLIEVDAALESMRNSGHDLSTAVGEVVDNAIDAGGRAVKIETGFVKGKTKEITQMAFSDNGTGISPSILPRVLTLGYSSNHNQRTLLGRFGMGLKVASISQARRVEIYTRQIGGEIHHTYIDLTEIREHKQTCIVEEEVKGYPLQYKHLMCDEKGEEYPSGTLVIWSKIDRLVNQGKYSSSLDKKIGDLLDFLARAYRRFLAQGLKIYLDGKLVDPYDPLFLIENPRLIKKVEEKDRNSLRAEIMEEKELVIDGQKVEFTVTLLPQIFRRKRGDGGNRGEAKQFEFLHLGDNAGKVSILRNGREIYYNIIPRSLPGGRDELDRFIGIEISFPAQLDEYFQVRNVKRGAEPVDNLREEFRKFVQPPVKRARAKIRACWSEMEKRDAAQNNEHELVTRIVAEASKTAPRGQAGIGRSAEEIERILQRALQDIAVDPDSDPKLAEAKRQEFLENPVSILSSGWPGKELFEIEHINGSSIVKLNTRHAFFQEIYCKLKQVAEKDAADWTKSELAEIANNTKLAIELLLMAYARAESLNPNADTVYSELRSYWGIFLGSYMDVLTNTMKK